MNCCHNERLQHFMRLISCHNDSIALLTLLLCSSVDVGVESGDLIDPEEGQSK